MTLPEAMLKLLADGLGLRGPSRAAGSLSDYALPPSRLPNAGVGRLSAVVGSEHADASAEARVRHLRGKSTPDLLRLRSHDSPSDAPDLVLRPNAHEQVLELLSICAEERIAVVPFGGGTSVVGGLEPDADGFAGVVALDLRRMDALLELDEISRLAVCGARTAHAAGGGASWGPGYTIGHFPQSYEYASLGGAAAARSSGQSSAGYGRFDELVVGLRVATPTGTLTLGRAPKSAAGPDLRQLILGSEGAFGVITGLTVRVRPTPEQRDLRGLAASVVFPKGPTPSAGSSRTGRCPPCSGSPMRQRRRSTSRGRVTSARPGAAAAWRSSALRARLRTSRRGRRARTVYWRAPVARRPRRARVTPGRTTASRAVST